MMAGLPVITEILASNDTAVKDDDGEYSDYIEIFNAGDASLDLSSYYLSDDPADLRKWQFPAVTLNAANFLVVYASSKDRQDPNGSLHTNFKLSGDGEFLALSKSAPTPVDPGAVEIVSGFDPAFPLQKTDVSYGLSQTVSQDVLISSKSAGRMHFPTSTVLGEGWTARTFNDASWVESRASIGYQEKVPGFTVKDSKSSATIASLATAKSVLAGVGVASSTTRITSVVNFKDYEDGGPSANFGGDLKFPNDTSGDDNNFAIYATGLITIPTSAVWTIGTNSDDGVQVYVDGAPIITDDSLHGPENRFGSRFLEAGTHTIELYFFELGGGSEVELFAAPGTRNAFDSAFRLIGDVAGGGLKVETVPGGAAGGGFSEYFATNTQSGMFNVTNDAYLRVPFDVANVSGVQNLTLRARYDDGFIAYLNGVEVARRNVTGMGVGASASDRPESAAVQVENISIATFKNLLLPTGNILAVHALNDSVTSDEFLFSADLVDLRVEPGDFRYFDRATPGDFNPSTGALGYLDTPITFSAPRGIYSEAFQLALSVTDPNAVIRYTTNGSDPSETQGTVYTGPFTIDKTTVVRVRAFREGYEPTLTRASTYLFLSDVIRQSPTGAPPEGFPVSTNVSGQILNYGMDPQIVDSPAWGPLLENALKAVPSMSLVMNMDDFAGPQNGIYTHAFGRGRAWEKPGSLELINPDGSTGFQVNAGVRIRGGFSRTGDNPKHAFRFFFRGEYGDSTLDYPLFEDEGVSRFEAFDLRTTQNYSWAFQGDGGNTFLRDVFARDVQGQMGQPYTRSRYYHLYINGQYWGLYQTQERAEADFGASYFGGQTEDYDVIKSGGSENGYFNEVNDGNDEAYRRLANFFYQPGGLGNSRMADYWKVQGMNPDGTRNANLERLLDVDNLIDYMISTYYTGDRDAPVSRFVGDNVNNYFAIYNRVNPDGFKFFEHDSEHGMDRGFDNLATLLTTSGRNFSLFNPLWMHEQLAASNAEYQIRFADRVHEHLYNDGPLTDRGAAELIDFRAQQIDEAIIAESARWGDSKREPAFTKSDWLGAVAGIKNWIPGRADELVQQFRGLGWHTSIVAPELSVNDIRKHGGKIEPSDLVSFTDASTLIEDTLSPLGAQWRYLDTGVNLGSAWTSTTYVDSSWKQGVAELGYGDGDEATVVGYGPNIDNKYITTYFRREVNITDPTQYEVFNIDLKRDDGAIVYVNGRIVARSNMTEGDFNYLTPSLQTAAGDDETRLFSFAVDRSQFQPGRNVIAVEVHQINNRSTDMTFDLRLRGGRFTTEPIDTPVYYTLDGSDPRSIGGAISPNAIRWNGVKFQLPQSARISVRKLENGQWSPLTSAEFLLGEPASASNLRIVELHYHPAVPNTSLGEVNVDRNDFEFVELMNISNQSIDLTGVRLRNVPVGAGNQGIDFDFAPQLLAPGARTIVTRNQAAIRSRYSGELPFALGSSAAGNGVYDGRLDNGGERITLEDVDGALIQEFVYDDWYPTTDGHGYSMEVVDPLGNYNLATNWKASSVLHGTPGSFFNPLVPGDVNGDRRVNIADFAILRSNFGKANATRGQGDLTGDGLVNLVDFAELRANFGRIGATSLGDGEPLHAAFLSSSAATTSSAADNAAPNLQTAAFSLAWQLIESSTSSKKGMTRQPR